ncbi:hypothetical protein [Pseudomonas aeruginosa]|uniref:hypothetical protein n=1 Tax=Pseudomonas aeruginosa TaxID=287 RepID=UPI0010689DD5|nr:hypothetical protein [Pseudomonas aeruginosa]TEE68684.1 hypothetical protein IPC1495_25000 [Pseudomonas aeruginosa]
MSDKVEEAVKAVIDGVIGGVIGGDAVAFARGLRKLSEASPSRFLEVGSKLLNPSRDEYVHFLGGRPLFAFDDTKVYGAVLTPSPHDSSSFFLLEESSSLWHWTRPGCSSGDGSQRAGRTRRARRCSDREREGGYRLDTRSAIGTFHC